MSESRGVETFPTSQKCDPHSDRARGLLEVNLVVFGKLLGGFGSHESHVLGSSWGLSYIDDEHLIRKLEVPRTNMELEDAQVEDFFQWEIIIFVGFHVKVLGKKCPEILLVAKLLNVGLQFRKCGFEAASN